MRSSHAFRFRRGAVAALTRSPSHAQPITRDCRISVAMRRIPDNRPDLCVSRLAARQWGVLSVAELAACGLSPSSVRVRVRKGWLHRLHRGLRGGPSKSGDRRSVSSCGEGLWTHRPPEPLLRRRAFGARGLGRPASGNNRDRDYPAWPSRASRPQDPRPRRRRRRHAYGNPGHIAGADPFSTWRRSSPTGRSAELFARPKR